MGQILALFMGPCDEDGDDDGNEREKSSWEDI